MTDSDMPVPSARNSEKKSAFSQALAHEKNERIVRNGLNDILICQNSLEQEIAKLERLPSPTAIETELLDKMHLVRKHYLQMKAGFTDQDDHDLRHSMTMYADAVQDLLTFIHRKGV